MPLQAPRVELGYEGEQRQRAVALMGQQQPDDLLADIRASVAALRARPETAGRRTGAVGWRIAVSVLVSLVPVSALRDSRRSRRQRVSGTTLNNRTSPIGVVVSPTTFASCAR